MERRNAIGCRPSETSVRFSQAARGRGAGDEKENVYESVCATRASDTRLTFFLPTILAANVAALLFFPLVFGSGRRSIIVS